MKARHGQAALVVGSERPVGFPRGRSVSPVEEMCAELPRSVRLSEEPSFESCRHDFHVYSGRSFSARSTGSAATAADAAPRSRSEDQTAPSTAGRTKVDAGIA